MQKVYLKKDIIRNVAKNSGYSQRVCSDVLEGYHQLLIDVVENGDRLEDFGYYNVESIYVPEHMRYDPRDNVTRVKVEPKFKVKISVGKTLKDAAQRAIKNIQD